MNLTREIYLICFGAASVIHAAQAILCANWLRSRVGDERKEALDGVALGLATFFWQFGNFMAVFVLWQGFAQSGVAFRLSNFIREGALVCFPLLFTYLSLHVAPGQDCESSFERGLRNSRYVLWPWTVLALGTQALSTAGIRIPRLRPDVTVYATLHLMLLYFVAYTVAVARHRRDGKKSTVASLMRAQKAGVIAGVLAVGTFALMLSAYWNVRVPLIEYIELAAMLTSVPFVVAVAYRQYQFPFMDTFIREVISGVILLGMFVAAVSISKSLVWITACAVIVAYAKAPLTRWVDRVFIGYPEPVEDQERRIGSAIRALTRFDEFGARVSEILREELEAEWVDVDSSPRADATHRFEIPDAALWLSVGARAGMRPYMSRQLRIAGTAALQLAAHHHQLHQHELRDATARAQMRALQAQINPHFLFNTLNVLASLIHSNPAKAERVTEELAEIFRYALESTRVEWVKLDDEVRFLESYLEIEKTRFQERLSYSFDIDPAIRSMKIPPMILQPVVENAVKHGIGPKVEGGEVRVAAQSAADRVVIVVEDTGMGHLSTSRHRGTGIGLGNVRERLHHLYGQEGSLTLEEVPSGGTRVTLALPQAAGVRS